MQQLETQVLEAERRAYEANQQVNTDNIPILVIII